MKQENIGENWSHIPVLKKEILDQLFFSEVRTVFDGTLGLGGHAEAILKKFPALEKYLACDLDITHIKFSEKRLKKWHQKTLFWHSNFSEIKKLIQKIDLVHSLVILLDLGICSTHVDEAEKGFSFHTNSPLILSFEQKNSTNAEHIINHYSENQLSEIFKTYGEEPLAKKIARKIIAQRKQNPIKTTFELRALIEKFTIPKNNKKTLTRIFQALRIAANQELYHLEKFLKSMPAIMKSKDRLGIIAYHSLEDRIVKKYFNQWSKPITKASKYSLHEIVEPASYKLITKKPIIPSPEEITMNPRSRSAKLRIIEKL